MVFESAINSLHCCKGNLVPRVSLSLWGTERETLGTRLLQRHDKGIVFVANKLSKHKTDLAAVTQGRKENEYGFI